MVFGGGQSARRQRSRRRLEYRRGHGDIGKRYIVERLAHSHIDPVQPNSRWTYGLDGAAARSWLDTLCERHGTVERADNGTNRNCRRWTLEYVTAIDAANGGKQALTAKPHQDLRDRWCRQLRRRSNLSGSVDAVVILGHVRHQHHSKIGQTAQAHHSATTSLLTSFSAIERYKTVSVLFQSRSPISVLFVPWRSRRANYRRRARFGDKSL